MNEEHPRVVRVGLPPTHTRLYGPAGPVVVATTEMKVDVTLTLDQILALEQLLADASKGLPVEGTAELREVLRGTWGTLRKAVFDMDGADHEE